MKLKVLVAIDSSLFSSEVLSAVASCSWDEQTAIRLVTAVQPASSWEETEQFMHQCSLILEDRVHQLKGELPQCEIIGEVLEGSPGKMIVETADIWGADLIIIGSHGDTGPRSTKTGSVASEVVNTAPCSVQVVKVRSGRRSQERRATLSHSADSKIA